MGLLKSFFGNQSGSGLNLEMPWLALNNISQLLDIEENSKEKPQLIFKHSTRCGISSMVLKQFEKDFPQINDTVDLYFLDLLNHRDISNDIASRFGVHHESPQLLILKNGKVVKHANHGAINDLDLATLL